MPRSTQRTKPPQYRRHQTPHQRTVTIGQRLQPGMCAGTVELIVKRALLVQHAVKDVCCDPPRREPGHFGWQCKSLRRHWNGIISGKAMAVARIRAAIARKIALACEYAKCKNRLCDFPVQV
jgi:hypothetical protein